MLRNACLERSACCPSIFRRASDYCADSTPRPRAGHLARQARSPCFPPWRRASLEKIRGSGKERCRVQGKSGYSSDKRTLARSEEHTSELQSLMSISYAVFCLKKKTI